MTNLPVYYRGSDGLMYRSLSTGYHHATGEKMIAIRELDSRKIIYMPYTVFTNGTYVNGTLVPNFQAMPDFTEGDENNARNNQVVINPTITNPDRRRFSGSQASNSDDSRKIIDHTRVPTTFRKSR